MNAGTSRGNAQAFNLAALQKLSDVKSTDGKTTLLHFVVEEVVRSEGKRCVLNRNRSLSRSSSQSSSNSSLYSENSTSREDREKEYIMIGLPVVGGLSAEFSNVKKAAVIDYNAFAGEDEKFLKASDEELREVREEQTRVMELVCVDIARNLQRRKTTTASLGSSSTKSPPSRIPVKFPNLPPNFMSDKSRNSSSSDSEDEF
ncbi:Formin-like protein 8 [Vitis vinifera]|uniref:Formin-like protein 8 n=1 Tax=Vitis vinifera TaxID=29760 RepID=A0A438JNG6_VITVI|nr:Formin-like protein 8 [Vitis vinifera]